MRKYKKEPFEFLSDSQLDELLEITNTNMSDKNKETIKNKVLENLQTEPKKKKISPFRKRRMWQYGITAAVVLILLAGFTKRDVIKMAYLNQFGTESDKLLLNADKLKESAEDQGLKLTAKSSFKDGDSTYVFMTLQDLTGNRLSEDTQIDSFSMLSGGNTRVVDYDEKTKTATLVVSAISMDDNQDYGYLLNRFTSNHSEDTFTKEIDWNTLIQTTPNWQKNRGCSGGEIYEFKEKYGISFDKLSQTALEPNVLNESLDETSNLAIENMAYKDNLLHVLVKWPTSDDADWLDLGLYSKTTNKELNEVADFQVNSDEMTGWPDYVEYVFDVPESELNDYGIKITTYAHKEDVEGNWAIQLKEPTELDRKNLANVTLPNQGELSHVCLSGMSLAFDYESISDEKVPLELSVILKNGTEKKVLTNEALYPNTERGDNAVKLIFDYTPLDDIKAVVINGQTIEVD